MFSRLRTGALVSVLIGVMMSLTLAQGPLQKQVNYSIQVDHALRMGDYILPPGKYVLYQMSQNNLNLFALYQEHMMRSPIAMIRTVRIEYKTGEFPEKTRLLMGTDETPTGSRRVLRGWNIPGEDGWEIIAVVPKNNEVLTRVK